MRSLTSILVLSALLVATPLGPVLGREEDSDQLVVHEWGTFTTLQDERGHELTGLNIDDEPVPSFVHNLSRFLLQPTFLTGEHWRRRMKGVPRRHPQVSMRLETPVIYFHLPDGVESPVELDVRVAFRGGWLAEYYPNAIAKAPGVRNGVPFAKLTPSTVGSLEWKRLRVGAAGSFPKTSEHVWTTPRKVGSDPVTTAAGESEQYVFYRGVARRRAPLRVITGEDRRELEVRANFDEIECSAETRVPAMWLVDVRPDGTAAYREVESVPVTSDKDAVLTTIDASFEERDYHSFRVVELKKRMWIALQQDGLYGDEAQAMLDTWNRAYFESPGRRLFFVVPREWTDHYLPLEIPRADKIERVMIGRIELVTSRQRELLAELARVEKLDASWVGRIPQSDARKRFLAGRIDFGELGVEIPPHYRKYLALGRFRNALLIDEESRRPTGALTAFIDAYGLHPYRPERARTARATAAGR